MFIYKQNLLVNNKIIAFQSFLYWKFVHSYNNKIITFPNILNNVHVVLNFKRLQITLKKSNFTFEHLEILSVFKTTSAVFTMRAKQNKHF